MKFAVIDSQAMDWLKFRPKLVLDNKDFGDKLGVRLVECDSITDNFIYSSMDRSNAAIRQARLTPAWR